MKRRGPRRPGEAGVRGAAAERPRAPLDGGGPNFWAELYWFTMICLGGWILSLAVLPPAMVRLREVLEFETRCRQRVEALSARGAALGRVVNAFETDPQYREELTKNSREVDTSALDQYT